MISSWKSFLYSSQQSSVERKPIFFKYYLIEHFFHYLLQIFSMMKFFYRKYCLHFLVVQKS
jgi:hypothetical protein